MNNYKILLLDFDGVISDSLKICMEEINKIAENYFPAIPKIYSKEDMTKIYSVQLRHSLYPFGLNDEETKYFFNEHSKSMSNRVDEINPFEEAVNAINKCNILKIIITSSYSETVYKILGKSKEYHNNFIQAIYGREQKKIKTEKIVNALKLFNIKTSEALFVGDLASDILYCKDVPVDIACVGYGYHPISYLQKFSPTYILETIKDFSDFLLLIDTINKKEK